MKRKQYEELKMLAEKLPTVPDDRFDMGWWGFADGCWFAGCAIGWLPTLVPGCGLRLQKCDHDGRFRPVFGFKANFEAVADYFGISRDDAEYIFYADELSDDDNHIEVTQEMVSKRIFRFLATVTVEENEQPTHEVRLNEDLPDSFFNGGMPDESDSCI